MSQRELGNLSSDNILDPNFSVEDTDDAVQPPNVRDLFEQVSMEPRANQIFHDARAPGTGPLIHDPLHTTPSIVTTTRRHRSSQPGMATILDDSDDESDRSFVDSETGSEAIWAESTGLLDFRNCSHLAHAEGSSAAATASIIAEALNTLLTELFPDHKTWKREPIGSLIRLAEAFLKNRSDLADTVATLTKSTGVLFSIQLSEVITNMVGSESWHDSVSLAICLYTWLHHPKATKKIL